MGSHVAFIINILLYYYLVIFWRPIYLCCNHSMCICIYELAKFPSLYTHNLYCTFGCFFPVIYSCKSSYYPFWHRGCHRMWHQMVHSIWLNLNAMSFSGVLECAKRKKVDVTIYFFSVFLSLSMWEQTMRHCWKMISTLGFGKRERLDRWLFVTNIINMVMFSLSSTRYQILMKCWNRNMLSSWMNLWRLWSRYMGRRF